MNWRLGGWCALIVFMSTVAFASRFSSGPPPKDVAYQWSSSILGLIQYGVILGILYVITLGLDRRSFLALRRPTSWKRQPGSRPSILIAVFVVGGIVDQFSEPGERTRADPAELGLEQDRAVRGLRVRRHDRRADRRGAPVPRRRLRPPRAVRAHSGSSARRARVRARPRADRGLSAVILVFGIGLAYLRSRTDSIYPCMLLHASFNAFGLIVGIAS